MTESNIPAGHPYRSNNALRRRYDPGSGDIAPNSDGKPNYTLRRIVLGAGIGVGAVMAFFGIIRPAVNAHNQDALNAELTQPFPDVAADIRDGTIDPDDVTTFTIPSTELAWTIASDHTKLDHQLDTGTVSGIISAQQGNPVQGGEQVTLPNSEIDNPQQ